MQPVSTPRPRTEDHRYPSPKNGDDECVPLGRLCALCLPGSGQEGEKTETAGEDNIDITGAFTYLDVLAARALPNAALSPLCRLPDDPLVRIMCHLDWQDIWLPPPRKPWLYASRQLPARAGFGAEQW